MILVDVTVRSATTSDENFCRAVDDNLENLKKFDVNFQTLVQFKAVLVAEFQNQLIGYMRIEHIFLKLPYISWITILPEYRHKGVGRRILEEFIRREKSVGAKYILSSAEPQSSAATAWHKHNGFYEIGTLKHMNQNGADELFFRLNIEE